MRFRLTLSKAQLRDFLGDGDGYWDSRLRDELGPLQAAFDRAFAAEPRRTTLLDHELTSWFDRLFDSTLDRAEVLRLLRLLRPGGGVVGLRQAADLAQHMQRTIRTGLDEWWGPAWKIVDHDNSFGSGGDLYKTLHVTTAACLCAAPLRPMCKIGTTEVTGPHGSVAAAGAFGLPMDFSSPADINRRLDAHGFAFVPLGRLGVPYSRALRKARLELWEKGLVGVPQIDIQKVIGPNYNPLGATHHSTGVYHLDLVPYVLSIFLRLGHRGLVMHGYDGIDELQTASSDPSPTHPTTLVIRVGDRRVDIAELGPEDIALDRSPLQAIQITDDVDDDARSLRRVFAGEAGPHRDFVVANAGALLAAGGNGDLVADIRDGARAVSEQLIGQRVPRARLGDQPTAAPSPPP